MPFAAQLAHRLGFVGLGANVRPLASDFQTSPALLSCALVLLDSALLAPPIRASLALFGLM